MYFLREKMGLIHEYENGTTGNDTTGEASTGGKQSQLND